MPKRGSVPGRFQRLSLRRQEPVPSGLVPAAEPGGEEFEADAAHFGHDEFIVLAGIKHAGAFEAEMFGVEPLQRDAVFAAECDVVMGVHL